MAEREAVSITPSGQILTFISLAKAKMILLPKFHKYVVDSPQMLARVYELGDIARALRANGADNNLINIVNRAEDKEQLCEKLWPELILYGRRNSSVIFGGNKPKDHVTPRSQEYIYCVYSPFYDQGMDLVYVKMPRQCKILVDLAVEYVGKTGIPLMSWFNVILENSSLLETKQDPLLIFRYYKSRLLKQGFIKIR